MLSLLLISFWKKIFGRVTVWGTVLAACSSDALKFGFAQVFWSRQGFCTFGLSEVFAGRIYRVRNT